MTALVRGSLIVVVGLALAVLPSSAEEPTGGPESGPSASLLASLESIVSYRRASLAGSKVLPIEDLDGYEAIRGRKGRVRELARVLVDPSTELDVHEAAIDVAGSLGDRDLVPPLLFLVADARALPSARERAIRALVRLGDPRATLPVVELLAEEEPVESTVTTETGRVLAVRRLLRLKRAAAEAIPSLPADPAAVGRLEDYVTNGIATRGLAENAALCLGLLGDARAIPRLRLALESAQEFPEVRREAILALGRLGDAESLGELLVGLEDSDSSIAMESVAALRQLGEAASPAIEVLLRILEDDRRDLYVRVQVPEALAAIAPASERVVSALVTRLGRRVEGVPSWEDPNVLHFACLSALQFTAAQPLLAALEGRLNDSDPEVAELARRWTDELRHRAQ